MARVNVGDDVMICGGSRQPSVRRRQPHQVETNCPAPAIRPSLIDNGWTYIGAHIWTRTAVGITPGPLDASADVAIAKLILI